MDYTTTPWSFIDGRQSTQGYICKARPAQSEKLYTGIKFNRCSQLENVWGKLFAGFAFFQKAGYLIGT
jgi:hypothetical protein